MSFFFSIDKSTSGSILHKVANRQLLAPFTSFAATSHCYHEKKASRRTGAGQFSAESATLETWFINALVTAAQCREHSSRKSALRIASAVQQKVHRPFVPALPNRVPTLRRYQHTSSSNQVSNELSTREELLALVDQYEGNSLTDQLTLLELPNLQQPESGPQISVSDETKDREWPPPRYQWPAQGEVQKTVAKLQRLLKDAKICPEDSYQLYRALPAPRVPYLDAATRHRLLHNIGVLERKDEEAMLRYLSVIDDMKATGIPLTTSEWNCATSFAGRYVGRTTEVEVEAGLHLWKEMEHVAGVRANSATFNILFDMATKAGKFRLAEMIYEEMAIRGHAFNRFHHVSLIHYYGLRADGDAVRKAYKALIEAGEIVDTVVLNCMISSLIRAYEPQAAEHVYERMKRLFRDRTGATLPSRDYQKRREVTKALVKMAEHAKRDPSKLKRFQSQSIIAPDIQTYRILIQYVAVQSGDLQKTVQFLEEMSWFEVPLNGSIFLALFKGFALHSGIRYSQWTQDRLESVWKAYLKAIDSQLEDVYVGKWMIIWALRAFAKCGNRERTIEAWEEIRPQWKPRDEELDMMTGLLRSLVQG